MLTTLLLLIFAHMLADYPLQGDFLSKAKNHTAPIPGVPWYQALVAHSAIHAGAVFLITGSVLLALAEFIVHAATDHAKCAGRISYNTDQAVHIGCKVLWVAFLL
ncbi:DUF3307 domain-containing protein [Leisingera sp. M523]|uniref:DUF3307 domain-containing protein n=1 Tax=Leisingera sp. M523 TaxID=2867013 RepID=UPI0021A54E10|nr:DUF3307 domain-containing protein [Leisingera sp. M523]UWQ30246.1 DUF3307 domain-containing protein [Leisingera sp. M523]